MDLRRLALTVFALWGACGCALASGVNDSTVMVLAALQDEPDLFFDDETLSLLDALLVDPVDLERGDRSRLRVIPWLEEESILALDAAEPPRSIAELARLPSWDPDLARRVAPFVRFARRRTGPASHAALVATEGAMGGRIESAHFDLSCRVSRSTPSAAHGFARLRRGGATLAAGELRVGHAQGLLGWTGETGPGAGQAIWRNARGMVGSEALAPARTLRGAGIEWRGARSRTSFLVGVADDGVRLLAAANARVGRTCEIQAAVDRCGEAITWSLGTTLGSTHRRFGLEVAGRDRPAVAAAGELRSGNLRCGARLDVIPPAQLSPLAGATTGVRERGARSARMAFDVRHAGLVVETGVARELRAESAGGNRLRTESLLGVRGRRAGTGFEARLVWRATQTDTWLSESASGQDRDATHTFRVRVDRMLRPGWHAVLELRAVAAFADSLSSHSGRGWIARLEGERGMLRPVVAFGLFRTDLGVSLAAPAPGTRPGTIRVRGDGMYAVVAARAAAAKWTASFGLAGRWTVSDPASIDARWSLAIDLP